MFIYVVTLTDEGPEGFYCGVVAESFSMAMAAVEQYCQGDENRKPCVVGKVELLPLKVVLIP